MLHSTNFCLTTNKTTQTRQLVVIPQQPEAPQQPEVPEKKPKNDEKASDDVTVKDDVINSKGEEVLKMLVTKYLQQNVAMAATGEVANQQATTSQDSQEVKTEEVGCHRNQKSLVTEVVGQRS